MRGMGELMFLFRFPPKVSAQPHPTEDRLLLPHHHPRSVCGSVPAVTRRGVGGKGPGDRGCPVPRFSASSRGGGGGGRRRPRRVPRRAAPRGWLGWPMSRGLRAGRQRSLLSLRGAPPFWGCVGGDAILGGGGCSASV